jgi:hypothetical protein
MNDNDVKRQAIIAAATEQFRGLLETHFVAVGKAAQDSFVEDENQSEPVAKASFAVEWDALAMAPKVRVKIRWTVAFKDESEAELDPLQSKLGLEGGAP